MIASILLALTVSVIPDSKVIDPAKSVYVTVTLTAKQGESAQLPDLRNRLVGFSLAEDFEERPKTLPSGEIVRTANWRLVPEPVAEVYKIRPFAVGETLVRATYFEQPEPLAPVTGPMEADPHRDLPPLSWKLAGWVMLAFVVVGLLIVGTWYLIRCFLLRVKEYRMSPIERAWAELDRLLGRGLPGRGKFKDFYVELTQVVRRYIQRKYGIKAPHMTTEEFLREAKPSDALREFLVSADMIKFAGVEATTEMSDDATSAARNYLRGDAQ